jgi:hypothetical protein
LKKIIQSKYKNLDDKLYRLSQKQTKPPEKQLNFYPRVINSTQITFTKNEITLLEQGSKCNLQNKKKEWLVNLALEAETAITLLPITGSDYYRKRVSDHLLPDHPS